MYFNNLPQGFGQAQNNQPDLMNKPMLGYNQGIGGLSGMGMQGNNQWNQQMGNPAQPAPQLQNAQAFPFGTPTNAQPQMPNQTAQTASTAGLGGKTITPLMPYQKGQGRQAGQAMAEGGRVRKVDPYSISGNAAAAARNMADKASFGGYKYGKAGADYAYDTLLGLMGYDANPDYQRELDEEVRAQKEGEENYPIAAGIGDIAGYAAPYLVAGPAEAALMSAGQLADYGKKAASTGSLLARGMGYAQGGVVQQNLDKARVVSEGIAALRGQHPDARAALAAYDHHFGPDATAELMRSYAGGGVVSGPGSGVADLVPGSIDGREDVRIASGEYVIPAWAVAALGDGSTEAGARVLDAMVARLREAGSELIMGTEPINPSEFLPA